MTAPVLVDPAGGPALDAPPPAQQRFRALLAPFDTLSGDGRMIAAPQTLRVRPMPQPLLYQEALDIGHDGAVVVGAFDRVEVIDGALWGFGWFDMADGSGTTQEVVRRIGEGLINGISVDIDDVTSELRCMREGKQVPCPDPMMEPDMAVLDATEFIDVAVDWRFMNATVVSQPAFQEARIDLDAGAALLAAAHEVIGSASLPIAARDRAWDAAAAEGRQAERAGGVDNLDQSKYSEGHFWRDPEADAATVGAYKLPFADVIDGTLTAVPAGVFAVAGALQGARGGVSIPDADADAVKGRVAAYYERMADQFDDPELVPPWESSADVEASLAASLVAAARAAQEAVDEPDLWRPPAGWFANPGFDRVVPLQQGADGRVFGHVAAWRDESGGPACHVGYPGTCKTVPHSRTDYRYFHTGMVDTDDGPLAVGTITLGTRHADARVSWAAACEHYADSGHGVAVGRAGEDEHGIWFAGALTPTSSREQRYTLGRVTISPDWREIGGNLEMVALLGVNTGGFPLPRAAADGIRPLSLVAAGIIRPAPAGTAPVDVEALAEAVDAVVTRREQRAQKARAMAARIRRERAARLAAAVRRGA